MPNIAALLKHEVARVARREVRAQTEVQRRASAQYRRDIARLKREVGELSRQVAFLEGQERDRVKTTPPEASTERVRFSARGLKSRREKLGLSAADYGALVGVTAQTIYNWENGKSRPAGEQLAALVALRSLGKREIVKRIELLKS